MKFVIQRVSEASVLVEEKQIGRIDNGLLLLVGIHEDDSEEMVEWMCEKVLNMRIFGDEDGLMNYSVKDVNGGLLVVPQFTLYGDARKGNRPSYTKAAKPNKARELYHKIVEYFKLNLESKVETGEFGSYMDVHLHNDGPVTILLER